MNVLSLVVPPLVVLAGFCGYQVWALWRTRPGLAERTCAKRGHDLSGRLFPADMVIGVSRQCQRCGRFVEYGPPIGYERWAPKP